MKRYVYYFSMMLMVLLAVSACNRSNSRPRRGGVSILTQLPAVVPTSFW